ncbi:MAG: hypothetical protein IVW57_16315 [Ktedonobacterales bacterium]|nr:hypothetical protein [Ktedonobacterales bacterium]
MSTQDHADLTGGGQPQREDAPARLAQLALTPDDVRATAEALAHLNWGEGLTRIQIRRRYRSLPQAIFLRLPDSKRYSSVAEVLHDVGIAASRAEGEFLGPNPDIPEAESLAEGGPPAWGPSPLYTIGGTQDSGSAEDMTGLVEGD